MKCCGDEMGHHRKMDGYYTSLFCKGCHKEVILKKPVKAKCIILMFYKSKTYRIK